MSIREIRVEGLALHPMAVYGFATTDLPALAATLSRILAVPLYRQFSPLIGEWYTDINMGELMRKIQAEELPADFQPLERFQLTLNDPEPGYTAPEFPGGGHCLLRVTLAPEDVPYLEQKFVETGLRFKMLA